MTKYTGTATITVSNRRISLMDAKIIFIYNKCISLEPLHKKISAAYSIQEITTTDEILSGISKDVYFCLIISSADAQKIEAFWKKNVLYTNGQLIVLDDSDQSWDDIKKRFAHRILYAATRSTAHHILEIVHTTINHAALTFVNQQLLNDINAFEQVFELARTELKDKDKTIKAWEQVSGFAADERQFEKRIINAQEKLNQYANEEHHEKNKQLAAWENIAHFSQKREQQLEASVAAHERLEEYIRHKLISNEKFEDAWEHVSELSRNEMIALFQQLKKHAQQKDAIIENLKKTIEQLSHE